jgi:4'-phosphopantetheinyl transferase
MTRAPVHVWRAGLTATSAQLRRLDDTLDADERQRAAGLAPAQRRRFVIARGVLRAILARYLQTEPHAVKLRAGPRGKPQLAEVHGSTLCFSVSHTGDLAVYAVAESAPVGVDVERVRADVWSRRLVEQTFSVDELRQVPGASGSARNTALFRAWTRKEAYLKALGCGLVEELNQVSVPPGWLVGDLSAIPGHEGAVVVGPSASRGRHG